MPGFHVPIRHREFVEWIPPSDVDGIDADFKSLRTAINVDFNNGFIENARKPFLRVNPTLVTNDITNGYSLESVKYFWHKDRGHCWFFVLYKGGSVPNIKLYVQEGDEINSAIELNVDEQNSNVSWSGRPSNINYNLVNDQLKINLNNNLTYNFLDKTIVANLTLVYLDEVEWAPTLIRQAGWYLCPRWLGWSNITNVLSVTSTPGIVEDFEDITYLYNLSSSDFERKADFFKSGAYSFGIADNSASALGETKSFSMTITQGTEVGKISFSFLLTSDFDIWGFLGNYIKITNVSTSEERIVGLYNSLKFPEAGIPNETWLDCEIDITEVSTDVTIEFISVAAISYDFFGFSYYFDSIRYDNISITNQLGYLVVAKYVDKQRSLLFAGSNLDPENFSLLVKEIDWRIIAYEIYQLASGSSLYTLGHSIVLKGNNVEDAGVLTSMYKLNETSETLNFNYGLGSTVRVDNERIITDEVFYRGRAYYVSNDEKVYMSHIAGSGLPQPDSFPYNEDIGFGFITFGTSSVNRALVVTPLDELLILAKDKSYVYTVQVSVGGSPFRQVKAINGSQGIITQKSLTKDADGSPTASFLMWNNEHGVFAYGGGRRVPKDVTAVKFKNYWKGISQGNKEDCVAFYNKETDEYWMQLGNEVIIYEIGKDAWKNYRYDFSMKSFVGMKDNEPYVLGNDNKVYWIRSSSGTRLEATLELHDNLGFDIDERGYSNPSLEIQHKILQEVGLVWKDPSGGYAGLTIIADDSIINSEEILYSCNLSLHSLLSPLLIRYGKIRFKIRIPATAAKLKEFFYTYSLPKQSPTMPAKAVEGFGQSEGLKEGKF